MKRAIAVAVGLAGIWLCWRVACNGQIPSKERVARSKVAALGFKSACARSGIAWPPAKVTLLAFKQEKRLEVWAAGSVGAFSKIGEFPILAASGTLGPKRREGDKQVPEGEYGLTKLNPNSSYHLSIFVDYPNAIDVQRSKVSRSEMGGMIFVHGKAVSIGCIAIGDAAIEKVYGLCAVVRPANRKILICPVDFRSHPGFALEGEEAWVEAMYSRLARKLAVLK
ncbi:MAG: hypothetical protein U0R49_06625 [Fimbriimonadales bacterium]